MTDSYVEAAVKKIPDAKDLLIKVGIIVGIVVLSLAYFLTANSWIMLLAVAAVVFAVYYFPRLRVEYEVVYCDGQFDFDKIMGGVKRKTIVRLDLDNADILAPLNSHALDSYNQHKLVVKNFTSGNKDAKPFALICKKGAETYKVIFEPNQKMISYAKNKSPRKVVEI